MCEAACRYPDSLSDVKVALTQKGDGWLRPISVFKSLFRIHKRARSGILRERANKRLPAAINVAQGKRITDAAYRAPQ